MLLHISSILRFAIYFILAIGSSLATLDNETASNYQDQTSADYLKTLTDDVMEEANSANASQALLELVEIAKSATANDTDEHKNKKMPSRRFLNWFKTVISNYSTSIPPTYTTSNYFYTTPSLIDTVPWTETAPNIVEDKPQLSLIDEENILIGVLKNLTIVMEKLNRNIEEQISLNPLSVLPLKPKEPPLALSGLKRRRGKREASKAAGHDTVKVVNATNATTSTATPLESITLTPLPNPSTPSQYDVHSEPDPCLPNATRRFNHNTNSPVKEKLLNYLNETFNEIDTKIQPVQDIKRTFSSDQFFRIGYIVANMDTLEVSLHNLREDMEKHSSQWEDKKIFELFDKIMVTNKVVTNLIESLNDLQNQKKGSQIRYNVHR